jgi:hypothetical protein
MSPDTAVGATGAVGTVAGTIDTLVEAPLVPIAFVAVKVTEYEVPLVSPVIAHDIVVVEQVNPPGLTVAVYPVTADPPFDDGASHVTFTAPDPLRTAPTLRGALGGHNDEHVNSKRLGVNVWPAARTARLILSALAAPRMICFTSAGASCGFDCNTSAAAPATCGAAIDVPVAPARAVSDGTS